MNVPMSAHAAKQIAAKGFPMSAVAEVWHNPDTRYPSFRYPGQHKRIGNGICLCCDDVTGRIITVFVNQTATELRKDQTDADAKRWARVNGLSVR